MATLHHRLKFVLPIALAFLLPLLSILVNDISLDSTVLLQVWVFPALLILSMWYTFLVIRRWRSKIIDWKSIAIVISFVVILVLGFYYDYHTSQRFYKKTIFVRIIFSGAIVYIVQQTLWTQEKISTLLLEKEQLQSENLKVQLKELRNQMDPHFFFNSLNTLRSMVRQNHVNAEQFIIGLSDFYRQILKNNENTTLPLEEEMTVLKSYLFLMKNRNENALHFDLTEIDESYNRYKIPTLALQSVVENCFKHNSMSSKRPLKIKIRTQGDGYIQVSNNLQPKFSTPETSGLGLDLLNKRYQLLKIEKGIMIENKEDVFSVKLKLIPPR